MPGEHATGEAVRGIIFDFDGVLVESDQLHWRAYEEAFGAYGIRFSLDDYRESAKGRSREEVVDRFAVHLDACDRARISHIKGEAVRRLWVSETLRPVRGVVEFLHSAQSRGIRCAVASTSEFAKFAVERLGIARYFDYVAAKRPQDRPKPHPDVFLRALQDLGMQASDCLAIEDSPTGAEAARRAGLKVLRFYADGVPAGRATAEFAEECFATFAELHGRLGWGAMGGD